MLKLDALHPQYKEIEHYCITYKEHIRFAIPYLRLQEINVM